MAKRTINDCVKSIKSKVKDGTITDKEAADLLTRIDKMATERSRRLSIKYEDALRDIAGELSFSEAARARIDKRNRLLTLKAKKDVKKAVGKFDSPGEGLLAYLEGSNKTVRGSRNSVDYRAKAAHQKYFGRFVAELEKAGALQDFKKGRHQLEIYQELEQLNTTGGSPGITGNKPALAIASAINDVRKEMISRQNRAGAYIKNREGYTMPQHHDMDEIRRLGRTEGGKLSQKLSFEKWQAFVTPLLDNEATFKGANPSSFLRNVHEGLYTGVHGKPSDEAEVDHFMPHGSLAKKASSQRVLHFKNAEAAYKYNQAFGTKHLRDSVLNDLLYRSRNIVLMEALGPNPAQTFQGVRRELSESARGGEDSAKKVDSLRKISLDHAWNEVSGESDYASNVSLAKFGSGMRILTQVSKMGGVTLSSLGDNAFLHSELAFQGMKSADIMSAHYQSIFGSGEEGKKTARLMGLGLDGLMGSTAARWTTHSSIAGGLSRVQQKFFDLNFMNWWNDTHKQAVGLTMAGHLGEHANLKFANLPEELSRLFNQYDIGPVEWNAIRQSVTTTPEGHKLITPDSLSSISDSVIDSIVTSKGLKISGTSRSRVRTSLEEKVRVYIADRTDFAVPTPGAQQQRITNLGTQPGTALGETLRMLMMFKSFPITVLQKIMTREVYGRGANSVRDWVANDHKGKFRIAQLIAMTTIGGYFSGVVKDAIKGKTPKPLITDGKINTNTLNDAALRGGGMGILGDFLFSEYDRRYRSFTGVAAGPVIGQLDPLMEIFSQVKAGENPANNIRKFTVNNTPFINLFYIRPVIDYFVLWNIQEMMDPGSVDRMIERTEEANHQQFFINPNG